MTEDNKYISRCLKIAENGLGNVAPNPLVGCVITNNGVIIGEGYHKEFGGPHAEVNAINSVKNPELLKESTLYVNLEPCSHFGKTPPCSELIIKTGIPKVMIGTIDPFEKVSGRGIKKMEEAGIIVKSGILEKECRFLNRRFLTFHEEKRPYIILKWAQSVNGFIGNNNTTNTQAKPVWITDDKLRSLVHKWRSEEQAIMVGTNTALHDNPELNVREWKGKDPLRIVLDQHLRLPGHLHIFNKKIKTLVFTSANSARSNSTNLEYFSIDFGSKIVKEICDALYTKNIQSLFVEGGSRLLQTFINEGLWDEARIFTGNKVLPEGVKAPEINGKLFSEMEFGKDKLRFISNQ